MEIILVLNDIRSTYNVGAILRTAEGFGLKSIYLSGYTPRPNDPSLLPHLRAKIDRAIHKTALGAENHLELYSSHDILSDLNDFKGRGYQIVGLDNNLPESTVLLGSSDAKHQISDRIVLILGEEVHGIDYSLHDIIDLFIEIPMRGQKESFNVSVATGIALFALLETML